MKTKKHQSPEFTLIQQNQANAKFFVASGGDFVSNPTSSEQESGVTQYEAGGGFEY